MKKIFQQESINNYDVISINDKMYEITNYTQGFSI